jgi:hypothetical protein
MSRYGIKPGAGGGASIDSITSTDGSIIVTETADGVDLSVNSEPPTSMRCSGEDLLADGTFQFSELERDGLNASVYNRNVILNKGWWHYDATVRLQWSGASNTTTPVQLYSAGSGDSMEFDLSYAHSETVQVSGEQKVNADGTQFVLGVTGIPTGMRVSLVDFGIHSITGEGAGGTYYAGTGIVINESDRLISVDTDTIQEKLTAGSNIVIDPTTNTISATAEPQQQADWAQADSTAVDYIKNKPDLSEYATDAELTAGLATKQDVISDLDTIRSGAALGATAVQPAALNDYATTTDLTNGLAGKQDTLTAGSNITITNNVISASAAPQEQANWAETDNTKVDYIKNKPANLVQDANYVHTDNNFTNADATKLSGIATGAEVNVQADWDESDSSSDAYIKNKPAIPRPLSAGAGIAIANDVVSVKLADNSIASDSNGLSVALPVPDTTYAAPGTVLTIRGDGMIWQQQSVTDVEVNGNSVVDSSGVAQITIPPSVTDVEVNGSSVVDSSGVAQITVPASPSMKELVAGANITITEGANDVTIAATAAQQVQANWNESDNTDPSYIQNKPTIPAAQVNSDWNAGSGVAQILNKPTLATVATSGDYDDLTNKPTIPAAQVNSDWNAVSGVAQILNKPTLATVATTGAYSDLSGTPSIPTIGTITI